MTKEKAVQNPIRVLMVDDHAMVRASLRLLLEEHTHICVVGEASNGSDAQKWLQKNPVDVILLDLMLKGETGLDLLPQFQQIVPNARIIILTGWHETTMHVRAVALGAHGLVLKDHAFEVLQKAIDRVYNGELWVERTLMAQVISDLSGARQKVDPEADKIAQLTPREREIITLIGEGLKNKVIAERLCLSETTVRHHLTSIFLKLEVADRLELVIYAFRHQLCSLEL